MTRRQLFGRAALGVGTAALANSVGHDHADWSLVCDFILNLDETITQH